MKLGVPKEIKDGETRVSIIPQSIKKIAKSGVEVIVEKDAGQSSCHSDKDYEEAGAKIVNSASDIYSSSDIVFKINKPEDSEIEMMKENLTLVSILQPAINKELVQKLATKKITTFSLDSIPRITRAQSMDILSSMATCAGYKAVLIAANTLPKFMPMFMTAAGTIAPAKFFVIGAGVAGLQAIATARRLGAVVEAFDTRPVVKEQVESLGARFLELDLGESGEGEGGYAKELSKEAHDKEVELLAKAAAKADAIITTAQIPGRKAPILITEDMVKTMQYGSVVVDLAAEGGGNCEVTEPGQQVVKHGVTISGLFNLPASMPFHASQMFSKNMENIIAHLIKEGNMNLDFEDEITKKSIITHNGEIVHEQIKELLAGAV